MMSIVTSDYRGLSLTMSNTSLDPNPKFESFVSVPSLPGDPRHLRGACAKIQLTGRGQGPGEG